MPRFVHRFISGLLVLFLVSFLTVPVCASGTEYVSPSTFVTWIAGKSEIAEQILSFLSLDVCTESEDGHHHASSYSWDFVGGYYVCICKYCGHSFFAYEKDLSAAYDSYVSSLPAAGYTSDGHFIWHSSIDDVLRLRVDIWNRDFLVSDLPYTSSSSGYTLSVNSVNSFRMGPIQTIGLMNQTAYTYFYFWVKVPFDGSYKLLSAPSYSISYTLDDGRSDTVSGSYNDAQGFSSYPAGALLSVSFHHTFDASFNRIYTDSIGFLPVYEIIPNAGVSGDTYNTTTRPTSIIGGNYGVVGDNNQIVKVEDNSTIVNETNNTYYNPATGQTVPITDWSYDYSDRSYKVNLESGDTVTVTYGDENITIQEGDTIYNVYYLIDGAGSEDPPAACEHDWQKGEATAPTCVRPGSATYVCSKCQETKTESISALGHDWQVKQTVTTEYDDTGQLVQEGYILYECSRCQEQYKSTDGTSPPHGGGEEEDGSTIGGMIEKLLSGVGDVVKGIIKGILSLLTKAVEALQGIADLFTTFVASVVELFGGFTDFLAAVFPFLPQEFFTILSLGLLLSVAAAVLRKFLT